jgi:crotonobetainyl-CoA:carnitine CoA-transferase CaiB-like acyl-CoA transferase
MTPLPLNDFLVIDLTAHRAGPTAVRQLADWGAQVIKIEPSGELVDATGSRRDGPDFQNLHRNKRAMTLNLKSDEGHAIFMKLAERTDVIVENYKSDVKHRLGIDYEAMRKVNPRIVYGSISGFGQDGPYAGRAGVDQIAQGMGGLMSITGHPGQGPVRVGIAINDTSAGLLLSYGIVLALLNRERTGEGQWVHTSLLEAQIFMLDFQAARYLMKGEVAGQEGNFHPTSPGTGMFETATDTSTSLPRATICGAAFARWRGQRTLPTIPISRRWWRARETGRRSMRISPRSFASTRTLFGSSGSTRPACHAGRSIRSTRPLLTRRSSISGSPSRSATRSSVRRRWSASRSI